nr:MAG TPA: hypothetical protein [Caudoviricetes sp.]
MFLSHNMDMPRFYLELQELFCNRHLGKNRY